MSGVQGGFNPSVRRLYKDCLRMVKHVAEEHKSVDAQQVRRLVRQQFMQNAHVTDPEKLSSLKGNAMSALTNYVMHISKRHVAMWRANADQLEEMLIRWSARQ